MSEKVSLYTYSNRATPKNTKGQGAVAVDRGMRVSTCSAISRRVAAL